MSDHTEGPWVAQKYSVVRHHPDEHIALASVIPTPGGDAVALANARLIAAAPELLAALKVVVLTPETRGALLRIDLMALRQCEAAIVGAEGGQL